MLLVLSVAVFCALAFAWALYSLRTPRSRLVREVVRALQIQLSLRTTELEMYETTVLFENTRDGGFALFRQDQMVCFVQMDESGIRWTGPRGKRQLLRWESLFQRADSPEIFAEYIAERIMVEVRALSLQVPGRGDSTSAKERPHCF